MIVDIARPVGERVNETVEIVEEFAGLPGSLVVVCGGGESVNEDLWARQFSAWVYLPGVSGGDALISLFTEAAQVVECRSVVQYV